MKIERQILERKGMKGFEKVIKKGRWMSRTEGKKTNKDLRKKWMGDNIDKDVDKTKWKQNNGK